jgi:peptide/nickel transport system permease protein
MSALDASTAGLVGEMPEFGPDARHTGYWRGSLQRLLANKIGVASAIVLLFFILVALFAPLISRYSPSHQDLYATFSPPTSKHWLGTDELGRDTYSRLIYGARTTLGIAFLAVTLQLLIGTFVGIIAGFYGGWLDQVLMRFVDAILAFPDIFLFLLIAVLLQPSPIVIACLLAVIGWADISRLIRAEVISLKNRDFVLATRSVGATDRRLMAGHILRNALPVIIVSGSLRIGQVILLETALDFLGLGVQEPTASWGNMLSNSETYFYHSVWLVVLPGIAIFLTVVATNLLGNALRDALDPRLRGVA